MIRRLTFTAQFSGVSLPVVVFYRGTSSGLILAICRLYIVASLLCFSRHGVLAVAFLKLFYPRCRLIPDVFRFLHFLHGSLVCAFYGVLVVFCEF